MKSFMALAIVVFALSGCASHSIEPPATYVSPVNYDNFDCYQLAGEMVNVNHRTNEIYHALKKQEREDNYINAIGLTLIAWPTIFALDNRDLVYETEYTRLKYEHVRLLEEWKALKATAEAKQCDPALIPEFEWPAPEAEPPQKFQPPKW